MCCFTDMEASEAEEAARMPSLTLLSVLIFTPASVVPERHVIWSYPFASDCHAAASRGHALTNKSPFRRELFVCKAAALPHP